MTEIRKGGRWQNSGRFGRVADAVHSNLLGWPPYRLHPMGVNEEILALVWWRIFWLDPAQILPSSEALFLMCSFEMKLLFSVFSFDDAFGTNPADTCKPSSFTWCMFSSILRFLGKQTQNSIVLCHILTIYIVSGLFFICCFCCRWNDEFYPMRPPSHNRQSRYNNRCSINSAVEE